MYYLRNILEQIENLLFCILCYTIISTARNWYSSTIPRIIFRFKHVAENNNNNNDNIITPSPNFKIPAQNWRNPRHLWAKSGTKDINKRGGLSRLQTRHVSSASTSACVRRSYYWGFYMRICVSVLSLGAIES